MAQVKLRPYQDLAIRDCRQVIAGGVKKLVLVAPTGSGKTVEAAEIIRLATEKGSQVMFMCHRRELVFQASDKLEKAGIPHGIFMAGEKSRDDTSAQVVSIQTFQSRVMRSKKNYLPPCDLMVIDECHQALAPTWREIVEAYPNAVVLGLTATPIRGDKVGLGHLFDSLVYTATIKELTNEGYLVPVRYYAPSMPDLKGVKVRMGDYVEAELEKRMNPLLGDVVENFARICPDRQFVLFATGVKQSRHLAERFTDAGIVTAHLDGNSPRDERDDTLRMVESGEIQGLCNCNLFTHGWDCPPVSCCILARPTKSLGLYVQMAGRVLRPHEGKEDCILIDHAGAVYQHGFLDDPMPWTLDGEGKLPEGAEAKVKAKTEPIQCENCKCVYSKRRDCPECGWEPPPGKKLVAFEPSELQEIRRGSPKKHEYCMEDKLRWWGMLEDYRSAKGYVEGWTSHQFRKKFGVWPRGMDRRYIQEPNAEVLGWIRSRQIAWAKRNHGL